MAPTQKGEDVAKLLKQAFEREDEENETFGAKVEYQELSVGPGFNAPELPDDLMAKVLSASNEVFESEPLFVGGGGSIPFMEVFSKEFPQAQFILTGCGFTDSNAHAPNENLNLDFCNKLTQTISLLLSKI